MQQLDAIQEAVFRDEKRRFLREAAQAKISAWQTLSRKDVVLYPGQEFSAAAKLVALAPCGLNCDGCGNMLHEGDYHFDHIVAAGIGGDNFADNCAVLCKTCHKLKTGRQDIPRIAKESAYSKKPHGIRKPSRMPGSRNSPFKKNNFRKGGTTMMTEMKNWLSGIRESKEIIDRIDPIPTAMLPAPRIMRTATADEEAEALAQAAELVEGFKTRARNSKQCWPRPLAPEGS